MEKGNLSHGTVAICERELEVAATNRACAIYADEFAGKLQEPYTGHLITDLLAQRQELAKVPDAANSFPEWSQLPAILRAVWAMARAAGSVKCGYTTFERSVADGSANLYEPAAAYNALLGSGGLGERTFFRLPSGFEAAGSPDDEQEGEPGGE